MHLAAAQNVPGRHAFKADKREAVAHEVDTNSCGAQVRTAVPHQIAGQAGTDPAVRNGHLFSAYLMLPLATTTLGLLRFNWFPSQARPLKSLDPEARSIL